MFWDKVLTYDYAKIADWLVMAGIVLFFAALTAVAGAVMLKVGSKKRNGFYGYKMSAAKINNDAYECIKRKIGQLWLITGIVFVLLGAYIMFGCMHASVEEYMAKGLGLLLAQFLAIIFCYFYVKLKVKKKYPPLS